MLDKLAEIEKKYEETESLLASAEYISDPAKLREAMKELKKLAPVVEKFREYKDWVKRTKEAEELLSEGDAELKNSLRRSFPRARRLSAVAKRSLRDF